MNLTENTVYRHEELGEVLVLGVHHLNKQGIPAFRSGGNATCYYRAAIRRSRRNPTLVGREASSLSTSARAASSSLLTVHTGLPPARN